MTPINSIHENLNANHLNDNIGSNIADVDELNFDFPEHSSEKLAKNPDVHNQ